MYSYKDILELKRVQKQRELHTFIGGLVLGGFIVGVTVYLLTLTWFANLIY